MSAAMATPVAAKIHADELRTDSHAAIAPAIARRVNVRIPPMPVGSASSLRCSRSMPTSAPRPMAIAKSRRRSCMRGVRDSTLAEERRTGGDRPARVAREPLNTVDTSSYSHASRGVPPRFPEQRDGNARMHNALAYHITWGTYGMRLHGDPRGTVDRDHNALGSPIIRRD